VSGGQHLAGLLEGRQFGGGGVLLGVEVVLLTLTLVLD